MKKLKQKRKLTGRYLQFSRDILDAYGQKDPEASEWDVLKQMGGMTHASDQAKSTSMPPYQPAFLLASL